MRRLNRTRQVGGFRSKRSEVDVYTEQNYLSRIDPETLNEFD